MTRTARDSSCVWRTTPDLLVALSTRFGQPLDAYVNGSQVWLREDGPQEMTLEWRLHPVGGYEKPPEMSTVEVFPTIVFALENGDPPPVPPRELWDGLECFAAYGDEIEPAVLASSAKSSLGIAPDAVGLVDHKRIGDAWEKSGRSLSIIDSLFAELAPLSPPGP